MYENEQWIIWALWMLPVMETIKEVLNRWHIKTRLKPENYAMLLHGIAFVIGLGICFVFEADFLASMLEDYRFESEVGYVAGAVALAGGETLIALLWDWRVVIGNLKPPKPSKGVDNA